MAGIFTDTGVAATAAANATAPTQTANCTDTLFYSTTNNCRPRFDPAAANALISELVAIVNKAGITYDCSAVNNVVQALCAIGAVSAVATGQLVPAGALVVSSDGTPMWNASGALVTVGSTDQASLTLQGFQVLGSSGVDNVGFAWLDGDATTAGQLQISVTEGGTTTQSPIIDVDNRIERWQPTWARARTQLAVDAYDIDENTPDGPIAASVLTVSPDFGQMLGPQAYLTYFLGIRKVTDTVGLGSVNLSVEYSPDNGANFLPLTNNGSILLNGNAPRGLELEYFRGEMEGPLAPVGGVVDVIFRVVVSNNTLDPGVTFRSLRHSAVVNFIDMRFV